MSLLKIYIKHDYFSIILAQNVNAFHLRYIGYSNLCGEN